MSENPITRLAGILRDGMREGRSYDSMTHYLYENAVKEGKSFAVLAKDASKDDTTLVKESAARYLAATMIEFLKHEPGPRSSLRRHLTDEIDKPMDFFGVTSHVLAEEMNRLRPIGLYEGKTVEYLARRKVFDHEYDSLAEAMKRKTGTDALLERYSQVMSSLKGLARCIPLKGPDAEYLERITPALIELRNEMRDRFVKELDKRAKTVEAAFKPKTPANLAKAGLDSSATGFTTRQDIVANNLAEMLVNGIKLFGGEHSFAASREKLLKSEAVRIALLHSARLDPELEMPNSQGRRIMEFVATPINPEAANPREIIEGLIRQTQAGRPKA